MLCVVTREQGSSEMGKPSTVDGLPEQALFTAHSARGIGLMKNTRKLGMIAFSFLVIWVRVLEAAFFGCGCWFGAFERQLLDPGSLKL